MRKIIILGILILTTFAAEAQNTMKDVFLSMPKSLTPELTENNRLDMVDFIESKMKARVDNLLDGHSELLMLNDKAFSLQISETLRYDVRLLLADGDSIICLVATYGKDAPESNVTFYKASWEPIPSSQLITLPQQMYVASFVSPDNSDLQIIYSQALNPVAMEGQKNEKEIAVMLKWNVKSFNKS